MLARHAPPFLLALLPVILNHNAAFSANREYEVVTSVPEGRAVCVFSATATGAAGKTATLRIAPGNGEGQVILRRPGGVPLRPVSRGFQPGCDIFPDRPARRSIAITADPATFLGIVPIHAHPGSDCGASTTASGRVTLSITDAEPGQRVVMSLIQCDGAEAHGNLLPGIRLPRIGYRGQNLKGLVTPQNFGPGAARDVVLRASSPDGFLINRYTQRNRCRFLPGSTTTEGALAYCSDRAPDAVNNPPRIVCDFDDLPPMSTAELELDLVPCRRGDVNMDVIAGTTNSGGLIPLRQKGTTRVGKGNAAILAVAVRSRNGGAGTVNIDPAPSTGTSLDCTAPDPQNPATTDTQCIETYNALTTVTLTATATKGSLVGWTGDCAGRIRTCVLTLDPAAASPDKSAAAKFRL